MPEYLAPGVFVEERPASLRAIEGVGTSTAAFVGPAERGPVAGEPPPFDSADGFVVEADPVPVLVTSYAQFVREFGHPLPLPVPTDSEDRGYLGHAVRAFFDNGGRRLYISRVVDGAGRNGVRLAQGVVARLTRSARQGQMELALDSLRGIDVGTSLQLRRRSDGGDALDTVAAPATLAGTVAAPFALQHGDALTVTITGAGPQIDATCTPVAATRAEVTSAAGPFALTDGDTLQVRVGQGTPAQTVTFGAADFVTIGAATPTEVALVLSRDLAGVSVELAGNAVVLRSDTAGTDAYLEIVGGDALGALGLTAGPVAGAGNVADLTAVTLDELRALFPQLSLPNPPFSLALDGFDHLLLTSSATGAGVAITAGGSAANALGLAGGTATGGASGAPAPTVLGYDTRRGTVELANGLPIDLDPNEIWIQVGTLLADGPRFHARSAGSWSGKLRVTVAPSDRLPVPVTAPAVAGADAVQVGSSASFYVGAVVEIDNGGNHRTTHEVTDIGGNTLAIEPALTAALPVQDSFVRVLEIDLLVADTSGAAPDEVYRGQSWNQGHNPLVSGHREAILRRHYATQVNARSRLVYVQPPGIDGLSGSEEPVIARQPVTNGFPRALSNSAADGLPQVGAAGDPAFVGEDQGPGLRTGIQAFAEVPGINLVAAPGRTGATVQLALIAHCERMRYRFAVLDGEPDPRSVNEVQGHRSLYETSHGAYYGPWIGQNIDGRIRWLPPSGFVAGIYARVDNERGVWKAPANETVRNAFSLRTRYTTGEQEVLNPQGVNLIRRFDTGGIRVWGARTLSGNPELRYVNVRRTLLFLEASIERGTQWVVFEPNTPATWARLTSSVRSFLSAQWREGALFGRSEGDAFFVRCDESTMTADDVLNGRLICEIGVAIVRPAEFVIFRIQQLTGFAQS